MFSSEAKANTLGKGWSFRILATSAPPGLGALPGMNLPVALRRNSAVRAWGQSPQLNIFHKFPPAWGQSPQLISRPATNLRRAYHRHARGVPAPHRAQAPAATPVSRFPQPGVSASGFLNERRLRMRCLQRNTPVTAKKGTSAQAVNQRIFVNKPVRKPPPGQLPSLRFRNETAV